MDFIEGCINSALEKSAATTGADATTTEDDVKKPPGVDVGSDTKFFDSTTAPPSPTSSQASWASHPWDDDEHWDDYQKYLDHNCVFVEEEGEEVYLFPSVWSVWTRTHPRWYGKARRSGGRRTTTRPNKKRRVPRRVRDKRLRRALRRKRLARSARVGGRRRRSPTSFRGGGDAPEGDQGTGEEAEQGPVQVEEQETGEETGDDPMVSGAQAEPAPPITGGRTKRLRRAARHGDELRPAAHTSTLRHLHPEMEAGCTVYGVETVPGLAKMLTGLTEDPNNDNLLVEDGVYCRRDKLDELESAFSAAYMFNPSHIGVSLNPLDPLNETKVEIGGRELVVKSFNTGKYTLEDGTEIGQWELLETRCGGGVTLDDECRRFVRFLVATYTAMMARGVPFERDGGNMSGGMLWNVDDAITRLESGSFDLDEGDMNLQ
ncbi:conserved unknown protein [Ectocarpus siliculosus]|uniref:Uncharacterized protein n=1 Tax=Ectocarpus siliculosus TaxID=2880 RepID=D7FZ65_ECTSI|nr:conserved unknown protein [Ectocarpus siliculosus]|eukprot:CBJ32682.1 conserved unknown protein [Ectocarpus siliculosus]